MQNAAAAPVRIEPIDRLRAHPQAGLVPAPTAEEYEALLADIGKRGLLTPLEVTSELVVLNGHQRLRSARALGQEQVPVRIIHLDPEDEAAYMLLAALRRRQLSASQKAVLALELAEIEQARAEAKARQLSNLRQSSEVAPLPPRGERTRELAARLVGVSPRTAQDALTVRDADEGLFQQVKSGEIAVAKAARRVRQAQRRLELPSQPAMPQSPFDLVYADPPWQLGGDPESPYAPENHYPTLPLAEIEALAVPAADDAVLFLWTTCGVLEQALAVMGAWGFDYRANIVWDKGSIGLGNWVRYQHELLLIGRRGHFSAPEPELRPPSILRAPRRRHSQKPVEFYELLERLYPHASKLELFARQARPGWACFGNEVER